MEIFFVMTVLMGCVLFLFSPLPDKHFRSRLVLGLVVCNVRSGSCVSIGDDEL